jgi:pyridoxine 5-phosphate synthase
MRLAVNIDHIATVRNARGGNVPDPVDSARIAERAGVDGIVCHLREDRRHIRDEDVRMLRKIITTKLDLEMAATPEIISVALNVKPDLVTLVPEKREELTTEGGLDVYRLRKTLKRVVKQFHENDIPVSLFVDPDTVQIKTAKEIEANFIELHTGDYANARSAASIKKQLNNIKEMASLGRKLGLCVNAGHGLDYNNIKPIIRISEIEEVSIGHAIIVRALYVGFEQAICEMLKLTKVR